MINLITGTPGAGKTLLCLVDVEARRIAENREVYYSGIADLNLPWKLFGVALDPTRPHMTDPADWFSLPSGCIIVIDECQRLYRPRANGSVVPRYVSELETHRHSGKDIYLVTQNPLLVDSNVRKLVDSHQHLMRKFGSTWATIHQWKGVKENVDKTRSDSQTREFKYPKSVYTWYKSAEVHTAKFKLPNKVKVLIALPFICAIGIYVAVQAMRNVAKPAFPAVPVSSAYASNLPSGSGGASSASRVLTAAEYAASYQPRVAGIPFSAPRYDDITRPTSAPLPAACLASVSRCKCYSEQATLLAIDDAVCRQIVGGGFYVDFLQKTSASPVTASPGTEPVVVGARK